jgi:hypothetical protein
MRLLTTDATLESLHKLLEQNQAGIFVLRDELTGWLTSLEKAGRESERSFYLECWNGDSSFTIDRIGRGSIYVDKCCVSLFGGIQPARLRSYFADAMVDGETSDGLLQRFQLLIWPDRPAKWKYEDQKKDTEAFKRAEEVFIRIANLSAEKPRSLRFSADAQTFFQRWLTRLMDVELREEDLHSSLESHFAKYRSLMPSLALLFSLADDDQLEKVGVEHAEQAAEWCRYLRGHAIRVYASRVRPAYSSAIALQKKIVKGLLGFPGGTFTLRDLYRHQWTELSTPEQARAALEMLQEHNWIRLESRFETEGARAGLINRGRPSEIYRINPAIMKRIQASNAVLSMLEAKSFDEKGVMN